MQAKKQFIERYVRERSRWVPDRALLQSSCNAVCVCVCVCTHESSVKYITQYKSRRISDTISTSFFLALQPINLIVCNFGGLQKKNGAFPSNVCRISVQPPGHSPVDKVTPSGMRQGVWRRGNVCEPPKWDRECKRLKDGDWVIKWHEFRNTVQRKFGNEREICALHSFKLHYWHLPNNVTPYIIGFASNPGWSFWKYSPIFLGSSCIPQAALGMKPLLLPTWPKCIKRSFSKLQIELIRGLWYLKLE